MSSHRGNFFGLWYPIWVHPSPLLPSMTKMGGGWDTQAGSNAPLRASSCDERQTVVLVGHPGSHWWSGTPREYLTDLWHHARSAAIEPFFMRGGASALHGSLVAKSKIVLARCLNLFNSERENGPRHQFLLTK
jgi:hypothetical protein